VGLLRRLAFASLVANVGIVVTGGAVRLTASGLGCPTWPRCTEESYRTTPEMGVHGVIEFGNRLLTFVLVAIAVAGLVVAWRQRPRRRELVLLAGAVLLIVPVQGIIGGLTVLTNLNPWVVGMHFLASIGAITAAWAFWRRTLDPPTSPGHGGPVRPVVSRPIRQLVGVVTAASLVVIIVGVVVTGSGPHAGDADAKRTGLDPQAVAQVHADLVFLLIGLSVALWFALRAVGAPATAVRAGGVLVLVELSQGLVGFAQYFSDLPVVLVGLHMLGACLVWVATLAVVWSTRERVIAAPPASSPVAGAPVAADQHAVNA
jgi:cytochrome c oxidase assembly protein subunit 15